MIRRNIAKLLLLLFLTGCLHGKIPYKNNTLIKNSKISQDIKTLKKFEAQSLNLKQKEKFFQHRLKKKFILTPEYIIKRYHIRNSDYIDAYLDESLLYLAYLALKYQKTQQESYQDEALRIIEGIHYFDNLNGFDGFMPRYLIKQEGKWTAASEQIKTNSYSLLAFAYVLSYQNFSDPKIKAKLRSHLNEIMRYFFKNDLQLKQPNGEIIKYAALDAKLVLSRQLDGLALFEAANLIVNDKILQKQIQNKLRSIYHKKYRKKNKITHMRLFGFWELASPSSNWLNFVKLYTATKATNHPTYKIMFAKLYKSLAREQNIFYDLLYIDIFPEERVSKISNIAAMLNSFPLSLDDNEILNSNHADIKINRFSKIIKNKRWLESKKALAIYNRPLVYHEWKRNQLRLNGNFSGKGNVEFPGLDFLLAYSLYQDNLAFPESNS